MSLHLVNPDCAAIVFDCDGTLVDSMSLHHEAWKRALVEGGARFEFGWEVFTSRAGKGLEQTVLELNAQFGEALDPAHVVAAQHTYYERSLSELKPIESVVAVARAFRGKLPMSVASGGQRALVLRSLAQIGILEWFDHVVCQGDVERGKPHPEMFLRCAELMGVSPERCLVFEDGRSGIEAAEAAGMAWVLVDAAGRCSAPVERLTGSRRGGDELGSAPTDTPGS